MLYFETKLFAEHYNMADPLNLEGLRGLIDDDVCLVEATCTTGFEAVAAEEIQVGGLQL